MDVSNSVPEWFSVESSTFGDRVAGAREAVGLSQAELARRLGVKLKTLRGWEEDLSEPRANKLQLLAGLLNVSLTWLLTAEGDGLEQPSSGAALSSDASELLSELSSIRSEM
ncbi:MAG: helix-turn-helix domain-containing protein, partial [Mangrovicoccus sp.]|nr:helix-turn-helix domain-containing protein [Mangrovicoccus sp.]